LTPNVLDRVDLLAGRAQGLVDYAFWRVLVLVLVLVMALLAAAVLYRLISSRIGRPSPPG
jgi:predicted Co/Zn/Cd cation transporter (cation efflux family)